jgi:hypothetical protein
MLRKLRPRSAYDVMAALALFLVVTGGTAFAVVAANQVNSASIIDGQVKSQDIANKSIGPFKIKDAGVANSNLGPGSVTSAKVSDGTLSTGDLAPNAVTGPKVLDGTLGAGDIQDPTRGISIPLTAFTDCHTNTAAAIDYSSGTDTIPDFGGANNQPVSIMFDSAATHEDEDTPICVGLTIPPDYVSGGELLVRANNATDTGAEEDITCNTSVNGTTGTPHSVAVHTPGVATASYTCPLTFASTPAPGDAFGITIEITSPTTMDNSVAISAVEFLYTAAQ